MKAREHPSDVAPLTADETALLTLMRSLPPDAQREARRLAEAMLADATPSQGTRGD